MSEAPSAIHTEAVDTAIATRRSVRAVLSTPVPRELVEDILCVTAHARSTTHAPPGTVGVWAGDAKTALQATIRAVSDDPAAPASSVAYADNPTEWSSPCL